MVHRIAFILSVASLVSSCKNVSIETMGCVWEIPVGFESSGWQEEFSQIEFVGDAVPDSSAKTLGRPMVGKIVFGRSENGYDGPRDGEGFSSKLLNEYKKCGFNVKEMSMEVYSNSGGSLIFDYVLIEKFQDQVAFFNVDYIPVFERCLASIADDCK